MICEQGKVVAKEADNIFVEVIQQSSCQACAAKSACGTRLINSLYQSKRHYLKLPYAHLPAEPEIGDQVEFHIDEAALLKSALLMYLLPLVALLAAAGLAHWLHAAVWLQIVAALLGLGISLLMVSRFSRKLEHNALFHPSLAKILPAQPSKAEVVEVLSA